MLKRLLFSLSVVLTFTTLTPAQEVEVDRYSVSARIDPAASAIDARASLAVTNLGQTPKSRIFLRLTKLAKISAVAVGGSPAQFEVSDDRTLTTLSQVVVSPQTAVAAGGKTSIDISYRIEAPESSPLAAIYPGEVVLLPEAVWVPAPSTMFTIYGATTAPYTLTVNTPAGYSAGSSGSLKADAATQSFTFEQPLNSLPFIIAGRMEHIPDPRGASGVKIEFHLQTGLVGSQASTASGDSVKRLYDEAARMVEFYTKTFGALPAGTTFRIISSARAGNVIVPGAVVLEERVFRQDALDAITVERVADAVARMWIDGRVRVRGQLARQQQGDRPAQKARSAALLRDSLPRLLAVLYIENRFGKEAALDAFTRQRWSYTPVAKSGRDAELGIQTPLVATYSAAVYGKGPLVFRLIAETAGREKFIGALRDLFSGGPSKIVTTDDLRESLSRASGPEIDRLFLQWVETIVEPDMVIGIPQPSDKPGTQRLNLRNLGNGDIATQVLAVTASGKQLTVPVTVPSEDLTSIEVATSEKIDWVEVDPAKLIIQTDYDNDRKPVRLSSQTLFNESIAAFNRGEHAAAESKLKESLSYDPRNELLQAWLARALFAQNKLDEARAAAEAAVKTDLPAPSALAWAHLTLGQIALARNQAAEAVQHLRRAVIVADEAPAQFASREALVRAERAASMSTQPDEAVRAFTSQLDTLIKQPTSDRLFTIVSRNNLKRFVQGLTVTPPTSWTTEILRADTIDANRVALDVKLTVKTKQADQSGTAVFVLYRGGSGWVLEDVQLFNVK